MRYRLEQRIHTLAHTDLELISEGQSGFIVEGVSLSPWRVDDGDGFQAQSLYYELRSYRVREARAWKAVYGYAALQIDWLQLTNPDGHYSSVRQDGIKR